jgi:hypothetical protein
VPICLQLAKILPKWGARAIDSNPVGMLKDRIWMLFLLAGSKKTPARLLGSMLPRSWDISGESH